MGYEETTVSKWVTNAIQPPMATFYRIALLLNRDLPELFVSTNKLSETDKSAQLKVLAKMAQQGKRTGKDKK
jgi:transcriptional regulator with XRE-family HTH domain